MAADTAGDANARSLAAATEAAALRRQQQEGGARPGVRSVLGDDSAARSEPERVGEARAGRGDDGMATSASIYAINTAS